MNNILGRTVDRGVKIEMTLGSFIPNYIYIYSFYFRINLESLIDELL